MSGCLWNLLAVGRMDALERTPVQHISVSVSHP